MNRTTLALAATLGMALPLGSAFAAGAPAAKLSYAQEYASYDRAAGSDMKHAAADLAIAFRTPDGPLQPGAKPLRPVAVAPDHARIAAAENWMERAETELLNRASFRDHGRLTLGQPINPDEATADVMDARADLLKGDLRDARQWTHYDRQELRMELSHR